MSKWIVSLCLITTIILLGCEKKNESSQKFKKESPQLDETPNKTVSPQSNKKTDETPVTKHETEDTSAKKTSEKHKDGNAAVSTGELWKIYKESRTEADKAKELGDYKKSIDLMLKGADAAIKLERPDLAAWQYNNAAKHAIDYYRAETNYLERMKKAAEIKDNGEKSTFKKETKSIMSSKFSILEDAEAYLSSAKKYDEVKSDPKRVAVIESNMKFIKEMRSIIE